MTSVIGFFGDRIIGTVNAVTGDRIDVMLNPEAPQSTAMNTGTPAGFPRINGYVLIPNESGATVGVISSIRVENLPYPKRRGTQQDFGLVDLPFPARLMTLTPLGTLVAHEDLNSSGNGNSIKLKVQRGVDVFPSVGDPVLLPTMHQLQTIVEGESSELQGRILLGHSPTVGRAPVYVDPDKLFGRHLAVLGNTGGGKSCTVAGLVRWSLEAAKEARTKAAQDDPDGATGNPRPNARFIVLDPNGEYAKAFQDLDDLRLFQVSFGSNSDKAQPLKVPAWLWNGEEWAGFTNAATGVQRPLLFDALRHLRSGADQPDQFGTELRRKLRRYHLLFGSHLHDGSHQQSGRREGVAQDLINCSEDLSKVSKEASKRYCRDLRHRLDVIVSLAAEVEVKARSNKDASGKQWHNNFSNIDLEQVVGAIEGALDLLEPLEDALSLSSVTEDSPVSFSITELPDFIDALASTYSGRDVTQFVDTLNLRIKGLLGNTRLASVLHPEHSLSMDLADWLEDYVGASAASNGTVAVIDLSLVPSDVIHIIVAVIARMVFEALQRYRQHTGNALPTTLVLEEAHTFVHRNLSDENVTPAGKVCSRVFERIAREGRKFGLGLVIASQRPSEISPTVLSQCNTFLLHRIVNDRDQDQLRHLVPDGLGGLLRELPSLPTRRAILLGWAAPSPVLVEIQEIPEAQRPHSPDPAFWDVWVGKEDRTIDWKAIADVWQGTNQGSEGTNEAIVGIGSGREDDVP